MTKQDALKKIKELEEFIKSQETKVGFEDDEIFLLSNEEYEKYKNAIPAFNDWWWLRSPGNNSRNAAGVYCDGSVYYYGHGVRNDYVCVRPALRISTLESSNLEIGDIIVKYKFPWVKIDENLAIAEAPIGTHKFDSKSNDYATSEIRKWLKDWLESRR